MCWHMRMCCVMGVTKTGHHQIYTRKPQADGESGDKYGEDEGASQLN